jgi:ABC-type multidrug transport system fused ATPase/permease subunit
MIRSLTIEKELRQKELMKMMSVPDAAIGWSWFTSFIMFYGPSAFGTALVTKALYENANVILLIIFWELSFLATIIFSFFVSSIFTKATRATLFGILGYFVGYFLSITVSYKDSGVISLVSLHPVVPFAYGLQIIGELEDTGIGLTWTSFNESDYPSGYTFANAIGGLISDIIIYGVLTWYLNRVVPSDFGTPLPWNFPFQKAYWCGGKSSDAVEERAAVENDLIPIEPVSDAFKEQEKNGRCVQLRDLSRTFGTKTAVDGLSLSMYSGQVTALLGHNGAGVLFQTFKYVPLCFFGISACAHMFMRSFFL